MIVPGRGDVYGAYRVGAVIGQGGFGQVRVAQHLATGETVALKFLPKGASITAAEAERFITEISVLADLQHPGIIRMREVHNEVDGLVIVLDYAPAGER